MDAYGEAGAHGNPLNWVLDVEHRRSCNLNQVSGLFTSWRHALRDTEEKDLPSGPFIKNFPEVSGGEYRTSP